MAFQEKSVRDRMTITSHFLVIMEFSLNEERQTREVTTVAKKGTPRRDGSGGGSRGNKGRGGCPPSKQPSKGKGSNRR